MTGPGAPEYLAECDGGVRIRLRVVPRASRDGLDGLYGGALKVRLTAPPVEGEANRAVASFLSRLLKVPKSSITIEAGIKSRDKRVLVEGARLADVKRIIEAALG